MCTVYNNNIVCMIQTISIDFHAEYTDLILFKCGMSLRNGMSTTGP